MKTDIIASLHPLEIEVLNTFKTEKASLFWSVILEKTGLKESQLRTAIEWLLHKNLIISESTGVEEIISLTKTGKSYATLGIPEKRIVQFLSSSEKDVTMGDLPAILSLEKDEVGPVIGFLKKHKDLSVEAGGVLKLLSSNSSSYIENKQSLVDKVAKEESLMMKELSMEEGDMVRSLYRKRGTEQGVFRIEGRPIFLYHLTEEGKSVVADLVESLKYRKTEVSQITSDILKDGKWKDVTFRKYNIKLNPPKLNIGKKHPYRQFLDWVRIKFISLGFKEMKGSIVENEFWNMDALFMPQFHSARNIHDVYYIKKPEYSREIEEPYLSNVAFCHEHGGNTGSAGWRYKFDREKTKRLILRSQGTVLSARTLAADPEIPGKYFAIARCFRYEQIDATHGTDFFQIEGIVLDETINFRKLLGLLNLFAIEIARAKKTKFTPAYFPFTEPSVELQVEHPDLGWIELGGAGIFRPEVTLPLGIKVPVIAWGLGIDRMAMVSLGISDIRQLFTHDLDFIRNAKAVI
ncbi:MAG TPA: phenylalanine--tRNA ligase subunit alpha [Candidatus Eremiobacteraeota bacterium]|nr:phenylalanine--tRNA ligase subunit alpha [Candidatus Eremiobacteraeota bacterium]